MIVLHIIAFFIFGVLIVFSVIQLKARLKLEGVLYNLLIKVDKALMIMRHLDKRGAFEAHDEVGETFLLLTQVLQELRNYFVDQIGTEEDTAAAEKEKEERKPLL